MINARAWGEQGYEGSSKRPLDAGDREWIKATAKVFFERLAEKRIFGCGFREQGH
jgi:hypothetical protein